jgi:hypothetical protein
MNALIFPLNKIVRGPGVKIDEVTRFEENKCISTNKLANYVFSYLEC